MSVLRRSPAFDVREEAGEYLLYDGVTLQLLSGAAARVWELIDGTRSPDEIASVLAGRHDGDPQQVRNDVAEFCADLVLRRVALEDEAPSVLVRPEHVGWVQDGDTGLVVDLRSGARRFLTPTAWVVWTAAEAHREADAVVQHVRSLYPDAPPSLEQDVQHWLDELVVEGFLRRG